MAQERGNRESGAKGSRGMRESSRTLTPNKFASRPSSLNGINKQLP